MLGIEEKLSREIRTLVIKKHMHFFVEERAGGWMGGLSGSSHQGALIFLCFWGGFRAA